MDVWVVAAAAGAGYIAQHWKNLMKGGQSISDSSSDSSSFDNPELLSSMQQFQDKSCHLHRLGHCKNLGNDVSERDPVSQNASTAEVSSSNGIDGEKVVIMENYEDCNVLSQTCLSPRFLSNDNLGDFSECSSDLPLTPYTREMGSYNRRILRSKRTNAQVIKPLNSLQSCLMAQLYKKHAEMEEYMFSSIPSPPTPTVRPLLVTDGSRIISRASGLSKNVRARPGEGKLDNETGSKEKGAVFGVPPLLIPGRNREFKTRRDWNRKLSNSTKVIGTKYSNSKGSGSSHGALLFCFGISVGIMSSLLSNKREVDKLNNLLKQTEDLVQDLQEELELKDSLTVKELVRDDYESQDTHEDTYSKEAVLVFSTENNDESNKKDQKEDCDEKTQEESMRKIEAELEAELARLEINMNSSTLDGQFSNLVELDPDSLPDIAQGELRADMFGRQANNQPYADRDGNSSSTQFINYAVSPRELTIRLHEVLESKLEERVKELETALQNSGKKVQYTETERTESWRVFSNSEVGSSSIQGSPISKEEDLAGQPVVIHLSGDPLHAYNETYDELTKVDGSEEGLPCGVENDHQESLHNFDQDLCWTENGGLHSYNSRHSISNRSGSLDRGEEDHSTSGHEDDSGGDDEMERYLIKQILEKTRQGSPAVLKARKILFSMDESEH